MELAQRELVVHVGVEVFQETDTVDVSSPLFVLAGRNRDGRRIRQLQCEIESMLQCTLYS